MIILNHLISCHNQAQDERIMISMTWSDKSYKPRECSVSTTWKYYYKLNLSFDHEVYLSLKLKGQTPKISFRILRNSTNISSIYHIKYNF